jgi:hypothetical protein
LLTTPANNAQKSASYAQDGLLATTPIPYGNVGVVSSKQTGGVVSSKGRVVSSSVAELDRRRADAIAADPLKPGMWSAEGRIGVTREDEVGLINRAAAKYGAQAPDDEAERYARALAMTKD